MTREDKVNEFRKAALKKNYDEAPEDFEMILDCMQEELWEFFEAADNYQEDPSIENRAQLCKEWADVQYVVSQSAIYFDIPADPAFNRVHNSNLTKVIEGKCIYREDGKILKPDTYVAADLRGL